MVDENASPESPNRDKHGRLTDFALKRKDPLQAPYLPPVFPLTGGSSCLFMLTSPADEGVRTIGVPVHRTVQAMMEKRNTRVSCRQPKR